MASTRVKVGAGAASLVLSLAAGLLVHFEGYVPVTYADPVGIPTICYGHTGPDVTPGLRLDRSQCERLLRGDLAVAYQAVQRCVHVPLRPYEAAAFTSFTYNVGATAFCGSTLVKKANAGDMPGACAELSRWVYAGGERLPGLVRRRAAERAMCEGKQS